MACLIFARHKLATFARRADTRARTRHGMATTFADELGKIAAVALDKKERVKEVELQTLRTHIAEEWKAMRNNVMSNAKAGLTSYNGRFKTIACNFKVLKPVRDDIVLSLPAELDAMYQNSCVSIGYVSGPPSCPEFDVVITFYKEATRSLGQLKRDRKEAEKQDKADATAKKVKVEPKVKVETQ